MSGSFGGGRPRILACMLEFDQWSMGRTWSYAASHAVIDGLRSQMARVVVVPSLLRAGDPTSNPWIEAAPAILKDERFDQVWVWITHSHYPPAFWDWIRDIAPVRVGVLMESLRYAPQEIADIPVLGERFEAVAAQLRHMTHVLSYDERDVAEINEVLGIHSRLYHQMLPEAWVGQGEPSSGERMVFLGTGYGKRFRFLSQENLTDLLQLLPGPEIALGQDARFDSLAARYLPLLAAGRAGRTEMDAHAADLQAVRRDVLRAVMGAYRGGFAMVALPALFKSFPGRVIEAMAADVPVLMPRIKDRPQTSALFEDGRHVMYYEDEKPGDIRRVAMRLRDDAALRAHLTANARERVMKSLTSEVQVAGILDWIAATPA